jgi:glycosyltransferase involved in cell wall biosynthesis
MQRHELKALNKDSAPSISVDQGTETLTPCGRRESIINSSLSIVIATRNRADPLRECLDSIARQESLPLEVIVVDTSDDDATVVLCRERAVSYLRGITRSAAIQRNQGAERARGNLVCFLDDDVVLETSFIGEIVRVFDQDPERHVGGVSGLIVNQCYALPSRINGLLLRVFVGAVDGSYAGRLPGPAVNFLPEDKLDSVQRVEWLLSGCVAYRRELFLAHRFAETFLGYSIAEDVHLSARVARSHALLCTTRARLYHKGMGGKTHTDWAALGESAILNRHAVMAYVLGRTSLTNYLRLFGYELVYSTAALLWNGGRGFSPAKAAMMLTGRLLGGIKILTGRSPHRPARVQPRV